MRRPSGLAPVLGVIAMGLLVGAALVGHANRKLALEEVIFMRPVQSLASFPEAMPGNGHSGRATGEEDYTDPYGGGDVPGPYGRVNDPYDGDWALAPLGGKARTLSTLRMLPVQRRMVPMQRLVRIPEWDGVQYEPRESYDIYNDNAYNSEGWQGTDAAYMGANGGGLGLKQHKVAGAVKLAHHRKPAPKAKATGKVTKAEAAHRAAKKARNTVRKQASMKAHAQMLYRSADAHEAEYGREGPNILDESVLQSAVGTNGAVIGVDGVASQQPHAWVHSAEPFSFACDPSIYGCETGAYPEQGCAH